MSCSTTRPSTSWANGTNIADKYLNIHLFGCWENVDRGAKVKKFRDSENICTKQTNWPKKKKKAFSYFLGNQTKGKSEKESNPFAKITKIKRKKGAWFIPMTPLTTLRTAQLFQMSWPRISSAVGSLIGSIGRGFSASLELEEPFVDSVPVFEAIVYDYEKQKMKKNQGGFVASPPVKYGRVFSSSTMVFMNLI